MFPKLFQNSLSLLTSAATSKRSALALGLPEGDAEENRAAGVESHNIADLVRASEVVRSINRQVFSAHQSWQGRRHERAFHHARPVTGGVVRPIIPRGRPAMGKAQTEADCRQDNDPDDEYLRFERAVGRCGCNWCLRGIGHPAKDVPPVCAGQEDNGKRKKDE